MNQTTTPTTAIGILCEATMRAYINISHDRNLPVNPEKAAFDMRITIKANLDTILAEWKEATEANLNENWLKELVNAQAIKMALDALKL